MKMNIKMKNLFTRMMAGILTAAMLSTCIPQVPLEVFAAEPIATMDGKTYYNFNTLVSDIKDKTYLGKDVIIDMLNDWDYEEDSRVDERIFVDDGCSLTLNMHGHMFNRRLTDRGKNAFNGELFCLDVGAHVTINGGADHHTQHSVVVHSSTARDKYATTDYTTVGGTLAGGSSSNGGGCFHMFGYSSITLNNVNIAGCRAEQSVGLDGYGGAIYLAEIGPKNGDESIILNDSLIYGCYAYNDGGAIYYNHAETRLSGDGKSSINDNKAAVTRGEKNEIDTL